MKCIIDRFEGPFAVVELEDGSHAELPRSLVPDGAGEGDTLSIEVDRNATEERKKRIGSLMTDLFAD